MGRTQAEDDEIIEWGDIMHGRYTHSGHNSQAASQQPLFSSANDANDQPEQEQSQEQSQREALLTHEMLLNGVVGRTPDHRGAAAPTDPFALVRLLPLLADYQRGVLTST